MNKLKKREYFAYQIINKNKKAINSKISLNQLSSEMSKVDNEFFTDFKIWSVLIIKWHFDYINSYLLNPSNLNSTISKLYELTLVFKDLSKSNWILKKQTQKFLINKWRKSEKTYDFLWPKTTKDKFQKISRKMVEPRVKQILAEIPNKFLKNKLILDSGCGTGRYIECFLKQKPKKIIGMDRGVSIIKENKKRFKKFKNLEFKVGDIKKIPYKNEVFDFVCSAGVLHHSGQKLEKLINEHYRVIKKNGYFFIFITAKGGLLSETWNFARKLLKDVPVNYVYNYLEKKINPLRMQGFVDHIYTSNIPTKRLRLEKILKKKFTKVTRLKGIMGADLTPEIYKKDKFYKKRFGEGDLRYVCKK
jgi:ubiquinone/menaquinone biosynthesis C-methylase UbiE